MSVALIEAQGIGQTFSGKTIFQNLSFAIRQGDRIGLIGPNGSGKSTLLQILSDRFSPDEGQVVRRKDLRVAYVQQAPDFDLTKGVRETIEQELVASGQPPEEAAVNGMKWLSLAGFDDMEAKLKSLSGGWRKRLQIVAALAQDSDVVMLDEPTNHLDTDGVEWLENLLNGPVKTWIAISHDRYFLGRTATRMAELDRVYQEGLLVVDGDYAEFLRRKDEYLNAQEQKAASLSSRVRREDAWLARGPKARTTKAKGRIDQAYELKAELEQVRDRMREEQTSLGFSASGRKTKKLIELKGVSKSLGGKRLFEDLNYVVRPGTILGLLGENGSGKTTLMRLMAEQTPPDAGEVIQAPDLTIVYFDQHRESLDPSWTLKRALSDAGDAVVYLGRSIHVVSWARRFRFRPEQLEIPIGELSGGERARVLIARLMLEQADVLLLDEPTNDLDIPTLETLEDSLADFPGAVVLVTHDRFMLTTLCDEFLGFDGAGHVTSIADFAQWQRRKQTKPQKTSEPATKSKPREKRTTKKLSYMEQREYDAMEEKILVAEEDVATWEAKVSDPDLATQSAKLQEACAALEKARAHVQGLYDRWAELEAKVDEGS